MTEQFRQVFEEVVKRLSELLCGQVAVLNSRGIIITTNAPGCNGVPFEQAYGVFGETFLRVPIYLNGQAGEILVAESEKSEKISPRLVQGLVDLVISQATTGMQLLNQHELKNKFIYDLLRGSSLNEIDILRDAQILGMDLTRPRAVILIDAADYILKPFDHKPFKATETQIWQRVEAIIKSIVSFFHLPNDTICAYIGDGEIAVLKAISSQDLAAWTGQDDPAQGNGSWANLVALKRAGTGLLSRLRHDTQTSMSISIGRYHPTLHGLAQSYQDARVALSLGKRFHGHNQIHCLDRLGIAAFIGSFDETTKIELARHLLSPLQQEPELQVTLEVFFQTNCYPSATARQLSIHRNTLSYRLDKIASLTGLDPRQFDDALQIRLALILRSLREDLPCSTSPDLAPLSPLAAAPTLGEPGALPAASARVVRNWQSSVQL